jgi:small subunit ribosomal protein S19
VWKGPYVAVSLLQDVIGFARRWVLGRAACADARDLVRAHSPIHPATRAPAASMAEVPPRDWPTTHAITPCRHPDWWTKGRFQGVKAPEVINTHCRSSVVLPDFIACKFGVHNGKDYVQLEVKEPMIGHKLGEFSPTRKHPVHKAKDNSAGAKRINPKTGKS